MCISFKVSTMCCKCPPFPVPTNIIVIYLWFSFILGIYIETIYVGPVDVHIKTIETCTSDVQKHFLDLKIDMNKEENSIDGNLTLNFDLDDTVNLNFRENPISRNQQYTTYISQRSFCKIVDDYIEDTYGNVVYLENKQAGSFCPILAGEYYVRGLRMHFAIIRIHREMLGYRKYQLVLVEGGTLLMCLELGMNFTIKSLAEYNEYLNVHKL